MNMPRRAPRYTEQFVENAIDDIYHGSMDAVISELNKMTPQKAMACAVAIVLYMGSIDMPQYHTFIHRLEQQVD
jgi:hypothetical protein